MNNKLTTSLSYLTTILTPTFLLGLGLRILLTPLFYNIEYRMPYFPADQYGMTNEERLGWAPFAIDYLINDADISYLAKLTFVFFDIIIQRLAQHFGVRWCHNNS